MSAVTARLDEIRARFDAAVLPPEGAEHETAAASARDVQPLLALAREVDAMFDDLQRAYPDPAPHSTERVTLARLNSALGHLLVSGT